MDGRTSYELRIGRKFRRALVPWGDILEEETAEALAKKVCDRTEIGFVGP